MEYYEHFVIQEKRYGTYAPYCEGQIVVTIERPQVDMYHIAGDVTQKVTDTTRDWHEDDTDYDISDVMSIADDVLSEMKKLGEIINYDVSYVEIFRWG